jgi:hypothetical protein
MLFVVKICPYNAWPSILDRRRTQFHTNLIKLRKLCFTIKGDSFGRFSVFYNTVPSATHHIPLRLRMPGTEPGTVATLALAVRRLMHT